MPLIGKREGDMVERRKPVMKTHSAEDAKGARACWARRQPAEGERSAQRTGPNSKRDPNRNLIFKFSMGFLILQGFGKLYKEI
jgi:hypothetical protein